MTTRTTSQTMKQIEPPGRHSDKGNTWGGVRMTWMTRTMVRTAGKRRASKRSAMKKTAIMELFTLPHLF